MLNATFSSSNARSTCFARAVAWLSCSRRACSTIPTWRTCASIFLRKPAFSQWSGFTATHSSLTQAPRPVYSFCRSGEAKWVSRKRITQSLWQCRKKAAKKTDGVDLKIFSDQIKFKYWGRTDVVFHSREIGRKEGDFTIFKDQRIFNEFLHDLENLLSSPRFKMFFIVVDKTKARQVGWDEKHFE